MKKIIVGIILMMFISGCGLKYQAYPSGETPEHIKPPQKVIIQRGD